MPFQKEIFKVSRVIKDHMLAIKDKRLYNLGLNNTGKCKESFKVILVMKMILKVILMELERKK